MFAKLIEKFWTSTPARIASVPAKLEAAKVPGSQERQDIVALLHMLKGEAQMLRIEHAAPLLTAAHQLLKYWPEGQPLSDEAKEMLRKGFADLDALCAGKGRAAGVESTIRTLEDAAEKLLLSTDPSSAH